MKRIPRTGSLPRVHPAIGALLLAGPLCACGAGPVTPLPDPAAYLNSVPANASSTLRFRPPPRMPLAMPEAPNPAFPSLPLLSSTPGAGVRDWEQSGPLPLLPSIPAPSLPAPARRPAEARPTSAAPAQSPAERPRPDVALPSPPSGVTGDIAAYFQPGPTGSVGTTNAMAPAMLPSPGRPAVIFVSPDAGLPVPPPIRSRATYEIR